MKAFAILLDRLSYTASRNDKLTLLRNYFLATPDPDRGFALAALTDEMPLSIPLRRIITDLSATRFDPVLFKFSRDYVGGGYGRSAGAHLVRCGNREISACVA
jgi:DNA ligase 1